MSIWRARAHEEGSGSPAVFRCLVNGPCTSEPASRLRRCQARLARLAERRAVAPAPGSAIVAQRERPSARKSRSGKFGRRNRAGEETLGMLGPHLTKIWPQPLRREAA